MQMLPPSTRFNSINHSAWEAWSSTCLGTPQTASVLWPPMAQNLVRWRSQLSLMNKESEYAKAGLELFVPFSQLSAPVANIPPGSGAYLYFKLPI